MAHLMMSCPPAGSKSGSKDSQNEPKPKRTPSQSSIYLSKVQQGRVTKIKQPSRSIRSSRTSRDQALRSFVAKYSPEQLVPTGHSYGKRYLGELNKVSSEGQIYESNRDAQTLGNDEDTRAFVESILKNSRDEKVEERHRRSSSSDYLESNSHKEYVKAERQISRLTPECICIEVNLKVKLKRPATGENFTMLRLMTLQRHLNVVEFWRAVKSENGRLFRIARLSGIAPTWFMFSYVSRQSRSDHDPSSHIFQQGSYAANTDDGNAVFRDFLNFCVREGKAEAKAVLEEARRKANRVKVLPEKECRFTAIGFKRDIPDLQVPGKVSVHGKVEIFF